MSSDTFDTLLKVDIVLLSGSLSDGLSLRVENSLSSSSHQVVRIFSLSDLEIGKTYFTENNNKVVRISEKEVSLVGGEGECVQIPIENAESVAEDSAEFALEKATKASLTQGIPLITEKGSGRVVFSLADLPTGVTFKSENGTTICRSTEDLFLIQGGAEQSKEGEPKSETNTSGNSKGDNKTKSPISWWKKLTSSKKEKSVESVKEETALEKSLPDSWFSRQRTATSPERLEKSASAVVLTREGRTRSGSRESVLPHPKLTTSSSSSSSSNNNNNSIVVRDSKPQYYRSKAARASSQSVNTVFHFHVGSFASGVFGEEGVGLSGGSPRLRSLSLSALHSQGVGGLLGMDAEPLHQQQEQQHARWQEVLKSALSKRKAELHLRTAMTMDKYISNYTTASSSSSSTTTTTVAPLLHRVDFFFNSNNNNNGNSGGVIHGAQGLRMCYVVARATLGSLGIANEGIGTNIGPLNQKHISEKVFREMQPYYTKYNIQHNTRNLPQQKTPIKGKLPPSKNTQSTTQSTTQQQQLPDFKASISKEDNENKFSIE